MTETTGPTTPAEYWEARYAGADRVWSGRVNRVLADVASGLPVGRALDLGCGEGGDAIWLARLGWAVTAVDLSPTAIARAQMAATDAGLAPERLRLIAADLATWTDGNAYDLVAASFFHSWPIEVPRMEILRRVAGLVSRGGHLLVVSHAAAPPWADPAHVHDHRFRSPEEEVAALALDPAAWDVRLAETRRREAFGPDGQPAVLDDAVVLVRRR